MIVFDRYLKMIEMEISMNLSSGAQGTSPDVNKNKAKNTNFIKLYKEVYEQAVGLVLKSILRFTQSQFVTCKAWLLPILPRLILSPFSIRQHVKSIYILFVNKMLL